MFVYPTIILHIELIASFVIFTFYGEASGRVTIFMGRVQKIGPACNSGEGCDSV